MAERGAGRWRLRLRRSRREGQSEAGFTLVEMLVSMLVFGIVISLAMAAVIDVMKYSNKVQSTADATSELRQALQVIDRQVRSGNVLFSPANETSPSTCTAVGASGGTCMRIYTQANGPQRCVQWKVVTDPSDGTRKILQTRSWAQDWQTSGDVSDWRTVASGLVNGTTQYPFTLQGADSSYSSRLLDLDFLAQRNESGAPTELKTSLSGRNTFYGYDAGICSVAPS